MNEHESSEEPHTDILAYTAQTVAHLAENIPAPIRNNAIIALNRLCTAAVEIPTALLEGVAAEKRAQSIARVKLIETSADQIAHQMQTNPEYARVAVRKFGEKILRERINIDQIAALAAGELTAGTADPANVDSTESSEISEDWINVFEDEAAHVGSDVMQRQFAKILAGEIRKPSSYSIKTVRTLAQLDNVAARLFRVLCSLSISLRTPASDLVADARVVSMGNAGSNSLQQYGLGFDSLNILQEYGLIIADYNCWRDYRAAIAIDRKVRFAATYLNEQYAFVSKAGVNSAAELRLIGVAFSRTGKELLTVVEPEADSSYTTALMSFFDSQGYHMVPVTKP